MKILFVVNPISGGRDKQLFLQSSRLFCQKYGIETHYFHTTGQDDIKNLKKKIKQIRPDRVASVGGDGTTLLTSLALKNTGIPFGIIPMGSANGMAKELGVNTDPMEAFIELVVSQVIVPLDMVRINGKHYSIHLGDVGINARVVENFSKDERRGWLAYAKYFVDAIQNAPVFSASIETGGKVYEHETFAVVIANTRMYGTGAIINPLGNPHDGRFEIVVVKQNDLSVLINLGLSAFSEKAVDALRPYYDIYQVTSAKIQLDKPMTFQLDGEVIGKESLIEAEILPAGVRYISTNENRFVKEMPGNSRKLMDFE